MPCCSWLTSSCVRVSSKNSLFGDVRWPAGAAAPWPRSNLPSAPLNGGMFWISLSTRASLTRKCSSSRRILEQLLRAPGCRGCSSWMRARCSSGISVPNCCDQRACVSLQALVASLAGIFSPSTFGRVLTRHAGEVERVGATPEDEDQRDRDQCQPCQPFAALQAITNSLQHPLFLKHGPKRLAERTGLEPATPGVTGRYSNQLNYRSNFGGC